MEPRSPTRPTFEYELPPTRRVESLPLEPAKISAFQKGWKSARNYTGKQYDILYDKARIFISFCRRLQIDETQYHAVFPDILSDRAEDFYINHIGPEKTWDQIYNLLDTHFNSKLNHSQYWTDWTTTTFVRTQRENPDKTLPEVLEIMLDKLQLVQRALGDGYQGEINLHTAVARACRGVKEFEHALMTQKGTCEALFADLRASLQVTMDRQGSSSYIMDGGSHDVNYTDRRYVNNQRNRNSNAPYRGTGQTRFQPRGTGYQPRAQNSLQKPSPRPRTVKSCYVCKQPGCWSTKHSQQERDEARKSYFQAHEELNIEPQEYETFLLSHEGNPPAYDQDESQNEEAECQATQYLQSSAYLHRTTGEDIYTARTSVPSDQFVLNNQYTTSYQGELWDTGAARVSTVGKSQVEAYLRENPCAKIDWTPGSTEIRFGGSGPETSIGTMTMENPLGVVTYHILRTQTPFLFCLHDADKVKAYYNNVNDTIVRRDGTTIPVIRKWGHPFFNIARAEAAAFLTEPELRRLHTRFGHPRAEKLQRLLQEAGHKDVKQDILEEIGKVCHHCQTHDPAPQRFKFSIKDECAFNYEVVMDIVQIGGKNALHVIDAATSFQAATFVRDRSAKEAWNALCKCWILVYQGPPDYVTHDPGTNFAAEEFRNNAKIMGVSCKEMPVEAHWALGKIERAHAPLRRDIRHPKGGNRTLYDRRNDPSTGHQGTGTTQLGPDGIGTYPSSFRSLPTHQHRFRPITKHSTKGRCCGKSNENAEKHSCGDHANITVNLDDAGRDAGPKTFRLTQAKPYHEKEKVEGGATCDSGNEPEESIQPGNRPTSGQEIPQQDKEKAGTPSTPPARPSQLSDFTIPIRTEGPDAPEPSAAPKRGRGRPRKDAPALAYLTNKEKSDYELAQMLRADGKITTPGAPFEESDKTEIDNLIAQGTIQIIKWDTRAHQHLRLWNTRL
ncbi:hypothetical protein MAPG_12159, partial [Magnaporthiopsis poae ATCC 64411]